MDDRNREERNRFEQHYSRHRNDYDRGSNNRHYRDLTPQFERDYRRKHPDDDNGHFYKDAAYERDANYERSGTYRNRDNAMERDYYQTTQGERGQLGDIRQGYGFSSFDSSYHFDPSSSMKRERQAQQREGYGDYNTRYDNGSSLDRSGNSHQSEFGSIHDRRSSGQGYGGSYRTDSDRGNYNASERDRGYRQPQGRYAENRSQDFDDFSNRSNRSDRFDNRGERRNSKPHWWNS